MRKKSNEKWMRQMKVLLNEKKIMNSRCDGKINEDEK